MRWDKILKKTLKYTKITQKKNWKRPKYDIGFVECKSVKMCVLAILPDMSSNSANIDKKNKLSHKL